MKFDANIDYAEIEDNLLHYGYNIDHLLSLIEKGLEVDDELYISAYRSFEGEVYENYVYEKLFRQAIKEPSVEKFIIKGPYTTISKEAPDSLMISKKSQIIYRARYKEIGEFDGLIFTDRELYFVEMTLVKSISNLKKRLRKKRALLEVLFPRYRVKALLILNEGATGVSELPPYATAYFTEVFSASRVLEKLINKSVPKPISRPKSDKITHVDNIKTAAFKYYATLSWISRSLRKKSPLDLEFFKKNSTQRYHDIYTKIYLGYITYSDFLEFSGELKYSSDDIKWVVVAIEKDHSGGYFLTYFVRYGAKKLDNITIIDSEVKTVQKDPYGITLTEMNHLNRFFDDGFYLTPSQHKEAKNIIDNLKH